MCSFRSLIFSYRCTSDKVAPYAILKHTTIYNATTSNAGIPEPPVFQGKPSATTKQKNMKLKQRKQSASQKSYVPGASAAGHTFLLSEIIEQPYGKPKTISPTSTTAQPNCTMSCNRTLFHQKSKLINQSTPFPASASTAHVQTTSIASTKGMTIPSKKITLGKSKNITQWPITTVQTKLIKGYKPLTSKLNGDPPNGDHFLPKRQRGKDGKQDNASLHGTVSPNFIKLSLAGKLPRTNKFKTKSMSQTKKGANCPSRKKTYNEVSSRKYPQNTSTSEMKHKSAEVTKLPKNWNNTNSTYETFKPTGKSTYLCACLYTFKLKFVKIVFLYN